MASLKHFGTIKGEIIRLISFDNIRQWGEIRDSLGLTNESLKPIIREMKKERILEENGSNFKVEYELWLQYKAFYGEEWAENKLKELKAERQEEERYWQRVNQLKKEKMGNFWARKNKDSFDEWFAND